MITLFIRPAIRGGTRKLCQLPAADWCTWWNSAPFRRSSIFHFISVWRLMVILVMLCQWLKMQRSVNVSGCVVGPIRDYI